jgi:hypothetical protein
MRNKFAKGDEEDEFVYLGEGGAEEVRPIAVAVPEPSAPTPMDVDETHLDPKFESKRQIAAGVASGVVGWYVFDLEERCVG